MANFLSKFFKPKWQSSLAATRIAAIQDLSASTSENKAILLHLIQNDSSQAVRHIAIEKLSDTQTLCELLKSEDQADRAFIIKHMLKLAQKLGLSLYDVIEDRVLLADIIVNSEESDSFINGLARIENEDALFTIACNGRSSKVRQAAAELIETEDKLSTLNEQAKGRDKKVLHITKSKLQIIRGRQKAQTEVDEKIANLLTLIAEHAHTDNATMYAAKLESLVQRWREVHEHTSGQQIVKWDEFLSLCQTRIESLAPPEKADLAVEPEATSTEQNDEQTATLLLLEQTTSQLKVQASNYKELHALDALIKTQNTRWIEATRDTATNKPSATQFSKLMTQLRNYLKALQAVQNNEELLNKLLQQVDALKTTKNSSDQVKQIQTLNKQLTHAYTEINWPISYAAPEIVERAAAAIGQSEELKQNLIENSAQLFKQFEQTITELDECIEERFLKRSRSLLKKAQQMASQLDQKLQKKAKQALVLRSAQVQALKDWQGFASSPRQNELCVSMESLAEQHLSPELKASKIKEMQVEWRSLGGAEDQQLWDRFKAAADKAFEPCAEYFKAQNDLKSSNLARRVQIIKELTDFEEQNNWELADWKAIEIISRQAKQEWRDAYPVDHKQNKSTQSKFNALVKAIDSRLTEQKQANLNLKVAIVESAEALLDTEDLSAAMESAKTLQAQWQAVGITQHGKDRALWKQFRAACDAIFAKRDQVREKHQTESKQVQTSAEQLCTAIDASAKDSEIKSVNDVDALISDYRKQFKNLGELPKKQRERIQNQYEKAMHALKDKAQAIRNEAVLSHWQEAARKALVLSQARQVEKAEQLEQLQEQFQSQVKLDKALENNFVQAWREQAANKAVIKVESQDEQDRNTANAESDAHEICIRCEIAAGIPSPESDAERRMQLQVSRLSEGLSSNNKNLSREEQLSDLLSQWYTDCRYTTQIREEMEPRISKASLAVFKVHANNATNTSTQLEDA